MKTTETKLYEYTLDLIEQSKTYIDTTLDTDPRMCEFELSTTRILLNVISAHIHILSGIDDKGNTDE